MLLSRLKVYACTEKLTSDETFKSGKEKEIGDFFQGQPESSTSFFVYRSGFRPIGLEESRHVVACGTDDVTTRSLTAAPQSAVGIEAHPSGCALAY
jgi:hypothetical protein